MNHDSPQAPLASHSKLCLARACPRTRDVLVEILVPPEVPSPRNYRFHLARACLGQGRQPRAKPQPKAEADMSIQCAYLPHTTSQANMSDRTAVLSTFTNYNDVCPGITATVPHTVCRLRMGRTYDKVWSGPREETTPRPKPVSASKQAPPRPSSASVN